MAIIQIAAPKFAVRLSTTRSESTIRMALVNLAADYRSHIASMISGDPQTSFVGDVYKLDIVTYPDGTMEVHPKLSVTLDTTRTRQQLLNMAYGLQDDLKADLRALVASDAQTTITSWHIHRATGDGEEVEP